MAAGHLGQGLGTIAAGLAVGLVCLGLLRSEAYLTRTTDALIKARLRTESDRPALARGMRLALAFGLVVAAVFVAIGIGTLFAG